MTYADVPLMLSPFHTEIYDSMKKKKKMKSGHGEKGKRGMYEEEEEAFPLGWGHHQDHMLSVINQVPYAPWWPSSKMRTK